MIRLRGLIIIALTISLCSCSESPDTFLERGVQHAERSFKSLHTNELARLSFQDLARQGASLVTFVTANAVDGAKLPSFEEYAPTRKWSVVLRQDKESSDIIIEGFGEDLAKPLIVRKVSLPPFEE